MSAYRLVPSANGAEIVGTDDLGNIWSDGKRRDIYRNENYCSVCGKHFAVAEHSPQESCPMLKT